MWVLLGQRDPWEMLDTTGPWGRQGQPEPLVRNEEKVVWGISESGATGSRGGNGTKGSVGMTGSPGPRGANGTNVGATVAPEAAGVGATGATGLGGTVPGVMDLHLCVANACH